MFVIVGVVGAAVPNKRPLTSTGVEKRYVYSPLPSSPYTSEPQHFAEPLLVTAQVWESPALVAAAPPPKPLTSTGVELLVKVVVPSPSWPTTSLPQHLTAPALVTAQVWSKPALTATTPVPSPLTFTGVDVLEPAFPLPSWPAALSPQHFTAPALVRAQVKFRPALTAATPLPRPLTPTGVPMSEVFPLPSWP